MNTVRQEEKECRQRMLRQCADKLGEHFDSVIILATDHHAGADCMYSSQAGSNYANLACMREMLMRDEARTRHEAIQEITVEPPDDPEAWQFL